MPKSKTIIDENTVLKANYELNRIKDAKLILKLLTIKAAIKYEYKEIEKIFEVKPITVSRWIKAFQNEGIEGLKDKPKGHRKSKLSSRHKEKIESWILNCKDSKGKPVNWTIQKLCLEIEKEMGIRISKTPLWLTLRKMNMTLKKPRPQHIKSDLKKQAAFKKNEF